MYHCKVMIVDEFMVSTGSTNFDDRSFRLNDEANLNIYDAAFAAEQAAIFDADLREVAPHHAGRVAGAAAAGKAARAPRVAARLAALARRRPARLGRLPLRQSHNVQRSTQGRSRGETRHWRRRRERWGRTSARATPALIAAWRAAIAADPQLTASNALPRVQLEDHLPQWLESFAGILAALPGEPVADAAEARDAEAHGLQRWQQGYDLHDVTREWGCLHRCLVAELERFTAAHPELPAEVFAEARMKLAEQISEAMSTSAQRYFQLERVEAAGAVHDLERALADVRELEKRRADLWQQAAHDLRGNLGVVSNVAQGLSFARPARRPTRRVRRPAQQQRHARCATCSTTSPRWRACRPARRSGGSRRSTPPSCCAACATTCGRSPTRRSSRSGRPARRR